jgi:nicotinamide riboside kinase
MKRIVLTGPESCGKSTMSVALAKHFNLPMVSEYSRIYFEQPALQYSVLDLRAIAHGQLEAEQTAAKTPSTKALICDTDLLTIKIWSEEKFHDCDSFILKNIQKPDSRKSLYLLCAPEGIAWEPDPLRENPHDRARLFQKYAENLATLKLEFEVLHGSFLQRMETATALITRFLGDTF